MNKKILIIAAVLVLIVAGVMLSGKSSVGPGGETVDLSSTEAALPQFPADSKYILLRLEDPAALQGGLRLLADAMPAMVRMHQEGAQELGIPAMTSMDDLDAFMQVYRTLDPVLGVADELSLLAADGFFYASFLTTDEKFSALLADTAGPMKNAAKWETDVAGSDGAAWTLPVSFPADGAQDRTLYLVKHPAAGNVMVLLSDSQASIEKMLAAQKDSAQRAKIERHCSGPSFFQMRHEFPMPNLNEILSGDTTPRMQESLMEMAWKSDGNRTEMEGYNDVFARMAGDRKFPTSGVKGGNLPLLGRGDLAYAATLDLPVILYALFPASEDPLSELFSMPASAQIPDQYKADLKTFLERSRLSMAAFMDPESGMPTTAYLYVETEAPDVLNKYYGMLGLLGLQSAPMEGWESAYSMPIPVAPGMSVTFARKGNALLVGLGSLQDFAVSAAVPEEVKDVFAGDYLVSYYANFDFLKYNDGMIWKLMQERMVMAGMDRALLDSLDIAAIRSIFARSDAPDRGHTTIFWNETQAQ